MASAPDEGLCCPECGSQRLRVVQTVGAYGYVLRRRKCMKGHNFSTKEVVCDKEFYNAWERERRRIEYGSEET